MAISDTQKVDYLWKKIGYAATKTDTTANKDATNEALPSPLQIRGDSLLVQSSSIPSSIPSGSTSIVAVYKPDATLEMPLTAIGTNGPGQRGQLGSATAYRTWQTGLQNWISPEFGATYSVRVFLDTPGRTTSNTTGTELFATASGEEWFFDYQSGVLNFSGTSLPSGISTKSVYISGARYTGEIGISNTVNTAVAAFAQANAAFAAANNASDSWVRNQANSAFIQANAAFIVANGAAGTDVTQNNSITAAFYHANASFTRANNSLNANTGGIVNGDVNIVGNVTSNSLTTTGSNGSISGANAIFSNYVYASNIDLSIFTTNAYFKSNAAFVRANNSLDANNGGTISGDIVITGNLSCNIVGGTF